MAAQIDKKYPWIGQDEQELFNAILVLENLSEVKEFLVDMLSPHEVKDFARRWSVAKDLIRGKKSVDIVSKRDVSKNTVSRVKRSIVDYGSGMSQKICKRLEQKGLIDLQG